MSPENVQIARGVRTPIAVSAPTIQRTFEERVLLRFPVLVRAIGTAYLWLPPSSRLRRRLTVRNARRIAAAFNRRDLDVVVQLLDPAIEFEAPRSLVGGYLPPDMPTVEHGRQGYLRMFERLFEVWDDLALRPEEVIDFGDRVLIATHMTGHGQHSGVAVDTRVFQVLTLRSGMIVRQRDFVDRDAALEAAGLSE
jgi:ketosteroid isomerase-like protein